MTEMTNLEGQAEPMDLTTDAKPTEAADDGQKTKRRRKNMFDVKPEELDQTPSVDLNDQPKDDQKGEMMLGPSTGGLQARQSEAKRALPKITREHEEKLAQAKRFAMEQSVQHVLSKQKVIQAPADVASNLHSSAQRQRALALMCRVYIGSINFQLDEEAVRASFLPFGPIRMIDLSRDTTTGKHKGFAFVEYEIPEAAQLALEQMNNVMMGGRNIKVGRPSNVPQAAPWIEQILEEARQYARIFISSIHPDLTENDIKSVFEAFGTIITCKLTPDQLTGKHKGFGFIEYSTQQSANDAIVAMNLFDLGGQYIRVGRAITPPTTTQQQGPPPAASMLAASVISATLQGQEVVQTHGASALMKNPINPVINASAAATSMMPSPPVATAPPTQAPTNGPTNGNTRGFPSVSSYGQTAPSLPLQPLLSSSNQPTPEEKLSSKQQQKRAELMDHKAAGESNLEREEKLEISGKDARYMMMRKLARNSSCGVVVLKNMVSVEEVDEYLEEEVTEECSRYGGVSKVVIYQERQSEEDDAEVIVKIFVEFAKYEEGEAAQQALNGRWFGGRCVQANMYDEDKFRAQDYTG